jgi:hypothetical protein
MVDPHCVLPSSMVMPVLQLVFEDLMAVLVRYVTRLFASSLVEVSSMQDMLRILLGSLSCEGVPYALCQAELDNILL